MSRVTWPTNYTWNNSLRHRPNIHNLRLQNKYYGYFVPLYYIHLPNIITYKYVFIIFTCIHTLTSRIGSRDLYYHGGTFVVDAVRQYKEVGVPDDIITLHTLLGSILNRLAATRMDKVKRDSGRFWLLTFQGLTKNCASGCRRTVFSRKEFNLNYIRF